MQLKQLLVTILFLLWAITCQAGQVSTCKDISYKPTDISTSKITFEFDKSYPCGQFINGDWWVSSNKKGPVIIRSITPEYHDGMNGYEITPVSSKEQSFDSRMESFISPADKKFPIEINAPVHIIKSISVENTDKKCRPCLEYAAILTILNEPLKNSHLYFRPGYFGQQNAFYHIDEANPKYLVEIPSTLGIGVRRMSDIQMASRYKNLQLDHIEGWVGRPLHPAKNMPNYGADIARDNAVVLLRMMMDDFDYNNPVHFAIYVGYLQMSLDLASMAKGGVKWPANGGHGNGRKLPILFASYIFEDESFKLAMKKNQFSEDLQLYRSSTTEMALFGRLCDEKVYWQRVFSGKGARDCRDPYQYIDGGGAEVGQAYQSCCTSNPWKYTALVLEILGMKEQWSNQAFFEYVHRWVNYGTWASPDPCKIPATMPTDDVIECIKGRGRYAESHGINKDSGGFKSPLGDKIWAWWNKE